MKKKHKKSQAPWSELSLGKLLVDRYFRVGAIFLLLTVGVVIYGSKVSYPLTLTHQANDILASQDRGSVLTTAQAYLLDVQPRYILVGLLAASTASMALASTVSRRSLEKALDGKISPQRWAYRGLTGLLFVEIMGLLSGLSDAGTLKLMGGMMVIWALMGVACEQYQKATKKPAKLLYFVGVGAAVLAVLPIALSAFGTEQFGLERAGWHVYGLYVVFGSWAVANLLNQWRWVNRQGDWKDYSFVNYNYLMIDVIAKILVAGIFMTS